MKENVEELTALGGYLSAQEMRQRKRVVDPTDVVNTLDPTGLAKNEESQSLRTGLVNNVDDQAAHEAALKEELGNKSHTITAQLEELRQNVICRGRPVTRNVRSMA